jgi:hypothetical protein
MAGESATAYVDNGFFARESFVRQRFWVTGLVLLLRQGGMFALYAAGVAAPGRRNLPLVGPSGHGKSTLALALVQQGSGICPTMRSCCAPDHTTFRRSPSGNRSR